MKSNLLSYNYFRGGSAWIILFAGILCYVLGYFVVPQDTIWKEIVIKVADVLVIGVIIGYLSNAAQFLGVFKKDLQDVIYGKNFLKQRKDIVPLWETISLQMFKEKFPAIHKEFLNAIQRYFPKDEVSYYNDYETQTIIEWQDKEKRIIKVVDNVSFKLIADGTNEIDYPLISWLRVNDSNYENSIDSFTVNGKAQELNQCQTTKEGDDIRLKHIIKLKGASSYNIKYSRTQIYSLDEDYYIGFRAKYIVKRLRVCLDHPEDMDVIFTCRGTLDDFEDVKKSKRCIEKKYEGVILPRQGYVFVLKTIK